MGDILFLCHRIPFPPDKGDKIRSWHILRRLAERGPVHLGCLYDDPGDAAYLKRLAGMTASLGAFPLEKGAACLRALAALASGAPITTAWFRNSRLARFVRETRARQPIAVEIAYSSAMAQYLNRSRTRRLVDFVDVDSEKWAQYAELAVGPLAWIYRREAALLGAAERKIAKEADASLFASETEAALFRRRAAESDEPSSADRIFAIPNGVDADYFDPGRPYPDPIGEGPPALALVGRMDYRANVDGATWLAREVLPRLEARTGPVRLFLVGAGPGPAVRALAGERVFVTGRVPDVRPWLAHATLALAPLRVARGIQNKALEAMAMAKAVVATEAAREGLDVEPGHHLEVAAGAEDFAAAAARLLADPDARRAMGKAARRRMIERCSWPSRLAALDPLLDPVEGGRVGLGGSEGGTSSATPVLADGER